MQGKLIETLAIPIEFGAAMPGTALGPQTLQAAGLHEALRGCGCNVVNRGVAAVNPVSRSRPVSMSRPPDVRIRNLAQYASWTRALAEHASAMAAGGALALFVGGDHSLSAGTVTGITRYAARAHRDVFVLWLDAHADFHSLQTSRSSNAHGTPAAFICGLPGFAALLGEPLARPVNPANLCLMGVRSIDAAEQCHLAQYGVPVRDMGALRRHGAGALLGPLLDDIADRNGLLHVSLDLDFLDPAIAPAVGTPVAGGASREEAMRIMQLLGDSGLVSSLDIVEFNPLLDRDGRTAKLVLELVARLLRADVAGTASRRSAHCCSMAQQD